MTLSMKKRFFILTLTASLALSLCACGKKKEKDTGADSLQKEESNLPSAGDTLHGFTVADVSRLDLIGADMVHFIHDKTGAELLYIANDDTNRVFEITFRTPALNDTGISHIFEHSGTDGSDKYPSKALFFNLCYQTYNTYINAATYNYMTTYPVASLSEAQLLAYADYYTDSCFHPLLLTDESIFREEAWRYSLNSPNDELTISGTVYSEMQGAMTIERFAYNQFLKTLFPGSTKANESGGIPAVIPDLTYEDLCKYHGDYYHPSNSLTCLYGSFEDYTAFLKLLDGYFSEFDKREIVINDAGYTPISGPVTAVCHYPLESGANAQNGSYIYYGYVCDTSDQVDLHTLDLLTTLLADPSSSMAQTMKEQFPTGDFSCYVDNSTPEPTVFFILGGVEPTDAERFCRTVDAALADTAKKGFDPESVDAIAANIRLSTLLVGESTSLGVDIIPSIASGWALYDDINFYAASVEALNHFVDYNNSSVFKDAVSRFLIGNNRTALVTTVPEPGLKETEDAALAEKLALIKAGMSKEEIDAIVAQTAALAEPSDDDASEYVTQLQAVTVQSLPEEIRIYDLADEADGGIRYITANANTSGVGRAMILLDASGLTTEQLLTFQLYTDLLGELDTSSHTRAQLASLTIRYLYDGLVKVSLLDDTDTDTVHPYLRMAFTALDDDLENAYDLLYEMIYESDVTDVQRLKDYVASSITDLKRSLTNDIYSVNIYRAMAASPSSSPSTAAFYYLNYFDYYEYLCEIQERLENEPEQVVAKLQAIQQYFDNSRGAIVCYAGSQDSAAKNRTAADAFLARLQNTDIQRQTLSFPSASFPSAIIIDSSVQYNLIYASYEDLGLSEYEGALDAVTALVSDSYLTPMLRSQYGVYSIIHQALTDGMVIETYRDPNIAETYAVYDALPDAVADLYVSQEDLDNYILAAYSYYALGTGELSGAESALLRLLNGQDQTETLRAMHSLKSVTVENFKEYASLYAKLMEKGIRMTAGGASAINKCADYFDEILDPFKASEIKLPADLEEDSIYASAALFCRENALMTDIRKDAFGLHEELTLGDFAFTLYSLIDTANSPEESLATLSAYGIMDGEPDDIVTREELALYGYRFLIAVGAELPSATLDGYDDLSEVDPAAVDALAFALEYGLILPTEEGKIAPKQPATRGELALYIRGIVE